jgi:hypothetical protein
MDKAQKQAAGIGTNKKPILIPDQNTPVDRLREGLAKGQSELSLLAGAGLSYLQAMAGFVPQIDKRVLPQSDALRPSLPYSEANLQHLVQLHNGYNSAVYMEWLHWAALSNSTMPIEAIPLLLNLASQFHETKPLTKRMIGARGRWLVRQGGNSRWRWVGEVETGKTPRLGKQKKQEDRVESRFMRGLYPYLGVDVRLELRLLRHPWSLHFSQSVLETLISVMQRVHNMSSIDQIDLLNLFRLNIHPKMRENMIATFESYSSDQEVLRLVSATERLLLFRMDVREAFGIVD